MYLGVKGAFTLLFYILYKTLHYIYFINETLAKLQTVTDPVRHEKQQLEMSIE